jgi:hypothetical protein
MRTNSRAIPFILGGVLALLAFAFFAWDLKYHWIPYSPASQHWRNWPTRHDTRIVAISDLVMILLGGLMVWWRRRNRGIG